MSRMALVIDDSSSVRTVVRLTLEDAGFDVIEAGDGVEALLLLDGRALDCVVCDVSTPRMDGPSLLRKLRSIEAYRRTPVVVVTTQSSLTVRDDCRRAGAGAWLAKPFQPSMLIDTIEQLTRATGAVA
ncbi:response regulator [Ideonella sp. A 288]|uniref:response regulator n=1 Tax=Ideonella sp. A 288 TaxID=1962181 RepID=UPI000B4AF844|nr:response regulator [Ideonella sp. A 288]